MRKKYLIFLVLALLLIIDLTVWKKFENRTLTSAATDMEALEEKILCNNDIQVSAIHDMKPKVALTFDDGPHPVYTAQVLDVLKEKGVKATFFLLGKSIAGEESVIERMSREGHLIGNHTFDHVQLDMVTPEEACNQLTKTYNLIYEITGQRTEFIRPPFGAWNKNMECDINMIPVLWTVDTLDWKSQNAGSILKKVVNKIEENDIILMHDGYSTTVTALEEVVDYLLEKGYELVTVDELIYD